MVRLVARFSTHCYNANTPIETCPPDWGNPVGWSLSQQCAMHVRSLLSSARPVPVQYRATFLHLYLDAAWIGVLSASAVSFVSVYATRQGASALQIGLLSASPAFISILVSLPTGWWLEDRPLGRSVFWAAAFSRIVYLLWVPLPLLLPPSAQIWALIGLTLLMSIPGTALAVGFNALFAEAVPLEWRGHVVGIRNALLSVTIIATSLLCGQILDRLTFPTGYQLVFGIGFLGAALSTVHLWFVNPRSHPRTEPVVRHGLGDLTGSGRVRIVVDSVRPGLALRALVRARKPHAHSAGILQGSYGRLLAILFAFYLAVYLAIPLFPIQWVNQLHLSDDQIALGTAVFYVSVLIGSSQLGQLTRRLGNQKLTAIGAMFMSGYPAFIAVSSSLWPFLVGSALGGFGWSLVGGALTNYLLEKIPQARRTAYLAWYNMALSAALLLGALTGPVIARSIGVPAALTLFAALRFAAALLILLGEK